MGPDGLTRPGWTGRRICVGMATYDDFDGVWFTIQAIRMYQRDARFDVSFVVIDNHPEGSTAEALRAIGDWIPNYRYVPFRGYRGTSIRDLVFRETDAEIVCCLDSHVLLRPGALAELWTWFDAHPDSRDLMQGPLLNDDQLTGSTHLEPTWGAGMFGQWGRDPRIDEATCEPFEIPMQGLGMFACLRGSWPGLNPRLRGFGGEEGYLHEKFRRQGGRVVCHPGLAWVHRFPRPAGIRYPASWEDRIRNYHLAWSEVGWDRGPIDRHFRELLGSTVGVSGLLARAREEADHELNVFDAVFCVVDGPDTCVGHDHPPGIAWRVERLVPDPSLTPEHRRLAVWRDALSEASRRGYAQILVIDGGQGPKDLGSDRPVVSSTDWDVWLMAADPDGRVGGSTGSLDGLWVGVHARVYARIRRDIGPDDESRSAFLAVWGSVGNYLLVGVARGIFRAIGAPFTDPGVDRPTRVPGIEVIEAAAGLVVRQPSGTGDFELNNTASMVMHFCDGQRTVVEVAGMLGESFTLERAPLAEVVACVEQLRRAGVLARPTGR